MPTNPLWLEHTEKAAWDTIVSLRQQLEAERQQADRLAPMQQSWRRIIELLERAKVDHGFDQERYVELTEAVCTNLSELRRERDALRERVEQLTKELDAKKQSTQVVQVIHRLDDPGRARASSDEDDLSPEVAWFARELEKLRTGARASGTGTLGSNIDCILDAISAKLEELEEAPRREALEHATEVGYLTLQLAAKLRSRYSAPDPDEI
jgi:seryl-tRNA synthetase